MSRGNMGPVAVGLKGKVRASLSAFSAISMELRTFSVVGTPSMDIFKTLGLDVKGFDSGLSSSLSILKLLGD